MNYDFLLHLNFGRHYGAKNLWRQYPIMDREHVISRLEDTFFVLTFMEYEDGKMLAKQIEKSNIIGAAIEPVPGKVSALWMWRDTTDVPLRFMGTTYSDSLALGL